MREPTLRRNGERMVTMRVDYTFGRDELVQALAVFAIEAMWDLVPGAVSRRHCDAAIHAAFREHGRYAVLRGNDFLSEHSEGAKALAWAEDEVARLYPGWRA